MRGYGTIERGGEMRGEKMKGVIELLGFQMNRTKAQK